MAACAAPAPRPPRAEVLTGLDVLEAEAFAPLKGKKAGVITNRTGVDRKGRSVVDMLAAAPGVALVSVFSPEHGFASSSENERISSDRIRAAGRELPLHSLYSGGIEGMRPKPEQLAGLDVLVFDIQDIGARFYTYLATMAMALEEAGKAGIEFMVLDRPNPIRGDVVEGPILEDPTLRFVTPTAYFQVPVRHGLTAGEMALWHNRTVGHPKLTVVKLQGWTRELWQDQTGLPWVPPSPNMPDVDAASLYPGIGIFEASNLSVGRGTPRPFRWIGAPWLKASELVERLEGRLDGVRFEGDDRTPAKSVFEGQACRGVRITVTDRDAMRPLAVFRHIALALRELHPDNFAWRWDEAKRMVGTDEFRRLWESGAGDEAFLGLFDKGPRDFEIARRGVLLY
ncbi:MAG: hypothetical protein A2V88_02945 [Elusimicrobia bacterium RBG_16_66_12]|nr:MAG: hypothetical protein A2V88_02945 [Elusimicrobia bacterium RBG_16_66_12]